MGGAVSAGETNDELIDNLIEGKYIRTETIIEAFRAIDRAHYYLPDHRESAYHDMAWKHGNLHLSAPCIYAEVMEALDIKPGLSFLNIGSGTGYINTMCGLILGPMGINHGIEVHKDVVDYANERLNHFMMTSKSFDWFDFCKPVFVAGDATKLSSDTPGYDRIYCGAACPIEYKNYMRNLLNIGGKLVLPLQDKLVVIDRTGQSTWKEDAVMSVSFASLIVTSQETCQAFPSRDCPTLYNFCRFLIRRTIRHHCIKDINLEKSKRKKVIKKKSERLDYEPMDTGIISSSGSETNDDSGDDYDSSDNDNTSSNNAHKISPTSAAENISTSTNKDTTPMQPNTNGEISTNSSENIAQVGTSNGSGGQLSPPENQSKWPSVRQHQRRMRLIQRLQGFTVQSTNVTQSQSERGVMAILSSVLRRRRNHRINRDRDVKEEPNTMKLVDKSESEEEKEILIEESTFNQAIKTLPLPIMIKRFLVYERFLIN